MVANSLASCDTDFGKDNCVSHQWRHICRILRLCNRKSSTTFQPQAHHTVGPPLPEDSPQDVRSEDNLTSPLPEDSPQDVRGGASPFQPFPEDSPQDVRNEEWGSAGHRAGPEAARWEGRCSSLCEKDNRQHLRCSTRGAWIFLDIGCGTIEGTRGCAALEVHGSFGHRLSHHCDLRVCCDTWTVPRPGPTAAYRGLPR